MNDIQELDLIRTQLRAALERELHRRTPCLRVTHHRSFRLGITTLAVLAAGTAAAVLSLTLTAASPQTAYAAAKKALAKTASASSGTITGHGHPRRLLLHARHDPVERQLDRGDTR